jgi:DNA-binding NarL/FixJ family response regulator
MRELKVLLVDDHAGFIAAAVRHLRRLSWLTVVGSAGNGVEAIAQCEILRPDVVLMDLAMPEMGGLQATRLIKAQDNPPYIVIASHFDDGEHRDHALRAGADAFVSKLAYIHEVMPLLEALAGAGSEGVVGADAETASFRETGMKMVAETGMDTDNDTGSDTTGRRAS